MKSPKKKPVTLDRVAGLITETHESLARSIAEGFRGVDKRFEEMETKLGGRIDSVEAKLGQQIQGLANRIDDLALNRATRDELLVLDKRVARIETKLGLDFKPKQHTA